MNTQKIFWSDNLRFLRKRRKLSQGGLANALNIKRVTLNSYENEHTKNPPVEILLSVSELFSVSVDTLLRVNLSKLGELKLRELEAGNDVYIKGGNLRVLAITVDKKNNEHVEYVPVKAKAGYVAGFNDPEYIGTLPKYSLPNLPKGGTYRVFPITGDSMLPIPDGSEIVGRYMEDWSEINPDTPCVVVLNAKQDFVFKLVSLQPDQKFILRSLNSLYQPFLVEATEVLEIWKFHSYITQKLPEPPTDMNTILSAIKNIEDKVGQINNKY